MMGHFSLKSGYGESDVLDFMKVLHEYDFRMGFFQPFDFTLTTAWGEAAEKAKLASPRRYMLLEDENIVGLFQGLVYRKFFYKGMRAGSTSGNGILLHPQISISATRFFINKILDQERLDSFSMFAPNRVGISGFIEKPNYTLHIRLDMDMDKVFLKMDKKTRNRVRKAEKLGVSVSFSRAISALKEAYHVIGLASSLRSFSIPSWQYTTKLHECFQKVGCESIIALSYGKSDVVTSVAHLIGFDKKLVLWQAGSTEEGYNSNAGSLIQAKAVEWAKQHGYLLYDMGGTDPDDPVYAGIHMFKSGFGGNLVTNKLIEKNAFYIPLLKGAINSLKNVRARLP